MLDFKLFLEAHNINLVSWNKSGDIKFIIGNSYYTYYDGDAYWLDYYVRKYKRKPGTLLNIIKNMKLPFKKESVPFQIPS